MYRQYKQSYCSLLVCFKQISWPLRPSVQNNNSTRPFRVIFEKKSSPTTVTVFYWAENYKFWHRATGKFGSSSDKWILQRVNVAKRLKRFARLQGKEKTKILQGQERLHHWMRGMLTFLELQIRLVMNTLTLHIHSSSKKESKIKTVWPSIMMILHFFEDTIKNS